MKVHKGAKAYKNNKGSVVTIGTFDGVHVGHAAILKRVAKTADKLDLDGVLLTFFPHPRMVLQKDNGIKMLHTVAEKKDHVEALGIQHLVVHPFTPEFSRLTATEYVRDILVDQLKAKKIIIGYDHRFGRNRTADINDLKAFGKMYDFSVEEITAQELDDVAVSSTKVRSALKHGDISTANNYLGYEYHLSGIIVKGKAIGRTLNYPTANLKPNHAYKLIPRNGVYVTKATIKGKRYFGITNIGTNPTVGGTKETIETYFLNYEGDLYNLELTLTFLTHIRDEATFDNLDSLKQAIAKDEDFAIAFIKNRE